MVQNELIKLSNLDLISDESFSDAQRKINQLSTILKSSYNNKIGMLDMSKLTSSLKESRLSLGELQRAFGTAGAVGNKTFNGIIGSLEKLILR